MIQANELRIGNLILFNPMEKIERFCVVKKINEKSIIVLDKGLDLQLFKMEFNGIPLTPEILEKCGFELFPWGWVSGISKGRQSVRITVHHYYFEREGQSPLEIKYLHQLQNLYFALTGEELKYTQ